MIKKTKDYDIFKFRDDNRAVIDQVHVKLLSESIKSKNLLELRPIIVNEDMEVMDGQHRLLAAKFLGVEIFYEIKKSLDSSDIISLNINKAWGAADFLNFFCKNGSLEYQKLQKFIKDNRLSLKVGLMITMGASDNSYLNYKTGKYVFKDDIAQECIERCWETIEYIKKMNGFSSYTSSARFWKSLMKLINNHNFDWDKWKQNISKMVERFGPRATIDDYNRLMMEVYNWRNPLKIDILDE